jgi:hypothetical protein
VLVSGGRRPGFRGRPIRKVYEIRESVAIGKLRKRAGVRQTVRSEKDFAVDLQ